MGQMEGPQICNGFGVKNHGKIPEKLEKIGAYGKWNTPQRD